MLHACVERFDVMGGRENILSWDEKVNKALETAPCMMNWKMTALVRTAIISYI
jgi:hypothetical protein